MMNTPISDTSHPRYRPWLKRLGWLVAGVLGLWAILWLLVPWVARQQIEKHASAQLGRAVQVGKVEFLPWSLELTLHDLSVAGQGDAPPQLQVKRIYVDAELESIVRLAPVVAALKVEQLQGRLVHLGDGRYDIDDILARLTQSSGEPPGDPLRFALFNVSLDGASLDFDDRAVGKQHTVRDLRFAVPFLSNLPSRRDVNVEPSLAFVVNGSRFESTARTTPFADNRATEAHFEMRDVDLAPYLPYLPQSLPVRLTHAVVGWDMKLAFEQRDRVALNLSGSLELKDVSVTDTAQKPLLAFDSLKLGIDEFRPLDRVVKLGLVEWNAPRVDVRRDAQGRLEMSAAMGGRTANDSPTVPRAEASSAPASAASAGTGGGWDASIQKVAVNGARVAWSDASVPGPATLWLHDLSMELQNLGWPVRQPGQLRGAFALSTREPAAQEPSAARVKFEGTATDQAADVQVGLEDVAVSLAEPYLAQFLVPSLRGQLQGTLGVHWAAPALKIEMPSLRLTQFELVEGRVAKSRTPLVSIRQLALDNVQVELDKQVVRVGKLSVEQPKLLVARAQDGRWMYESWLVAAAKAKEKEKEGAKSPPAAVQTPAPAGGWDIQLADVSLDGGNVGFEDKALSRPVALQLSSLKLQMKDWRPDGKKPTPLRVSGSIQSGQGSAGQLDYRGNLQMQPLATQGDVNLTRIPVHAFEPYFGDRLNIELLRADTSFKGAVRYAALPAGPSIRIAGDTAVDEFRANSQAASDSGLQVAEELLTWKSLGLRGFSLDMAPGKAPAVAVRETSLSDFYARVIIFENGRINLQDLVKSDTPAAPAPTSGAGTSAAMAVATVAPVASAPAVSASSAPVVAAVDPLAPVIQFGPVSLINGRVLFSDRFVKPNYSANLSDLTGKLGAFSSVAPQGQPQLADLELRGKAEGTASLEILGKLNPLAQPLAMDIKGKVRDLELSPLSPYSVKYAGHGIERGKLSVDVAYVILPNGQLTASNKLVLNQLTFGNAVEGAPNSLPVRLAVALLADRNGVIDIDLPVSGSLNDPQFRIGPIIFKVIVNLVVKAVTAPFSLLANILGGSADELSAVSFAPGSVVLTGDAKAGLDKVAKALVERPALKMTVVGTANLEKERDAYKRERLQGLLVAEKRRQLLAKGASAEAVERLVVGDAERVALLKEVFQRADIAKPRNAAGVLQEVAATDMEALLLANISVTEDAMRELAVQRGVVVKDYLSAQQLPVERLFLGAAKPQSQDAPAKGGEWSPHAELNLSTN